MDKKIEKKIMEIVNAEKGFIKNNKYRLIELRDDYCCLEGIMTESSLNPYGIAHGGYIFGLADTAGGAVARMSGCDPVTSTSSITFLRKAKGSRLIAKARPLKRGKTLTNCEVEIFDEEDKLVAKVILEYFNL